MALEIQFTQHREHPLVVGGSSAPNGPCNFGLVLSRSHVSPTTLDLFHLDLPTPPLSPLTELDEPSPVPTCWQKFLDLKTGELYTALKGKERMSRRSGTNPKLNLSPPRAHNSRAAANRSPARSGSPAANSPPSSCVSSDANGTDNHNSTGSPEATSMVLVGCPRCLVYVMLSEDDPKCPKCKSTVLLDFQHESSNSNNRKNSSRSRKRS